MTEQEFKLEIDKFIDSYNVMRALCHINKDLKEYLEEVLEEWSRFKLIEIIELGEIVVKFNRYDFTTKDIHFIINETNEEFFVDESGYIVEIFEKVIH